MGERRKWFTLNLEYGMGPVGASEKGGRPLAGKRPAGTDLNIGLVSAGCPPDLAGPDPGCYN